MSTKSKVRVAKDDCQSIRILKLYKRLMKYRAGVSIQNFLEEEQVTDETLTKDILCINQFIERETQCNRQAIKEIRYGRIRLVNHSYEDTEESDYKKRDYSTTPPYLLLRLDLEIEEKGCVYRKEWMRETGCSKRTFARYIAKLNHYYSNDTFATEDDMIKPIANDWYGKNRK